MSSFDSGSDRGRPAAPWREAAVLGGLWASVEIAAGSFLHNLRVPFAGMLLAATGVFLLAAGDRRWGRPGLVWRAAAVCALVKSLSPSAVILGPMIGIALEGFILEAALRAIGRRRVAYWLGGGLAVAWSLVQKIVILLVNYGTDIVALYGEAYRFAARQVGLTGDGGMAFLLGVAGIAVLLGAAAAEAGYRLGATAVAAGAQARRRDIPPVLARGPFPWRAVVRVAGSLAMAAAGFVVVARAPLGTAAALVAGTTALVAWRMPGVSRRILRPRLWIELGAIVFASAWLLGAVRGSWTSGMAAGGAMVIRAGWMFVAFGVLGATLRDARLAAWLRGGRLAELCANVDVAVSALPVFAAALADRRSRWRQPGVVVAELLEVADRLLVPAESSRPAVPPCPPILIVTGRRGAGKTTLLKALAGAARANGLAVGGVLQHAVFERGERQGYDIEDLRTGRVEALCRSVPGEVTRVAARAGRFAFSARGLAFGRRALRRARGAELVLVDEVGLLEVAGGGWAPMLDRLMSRRSGAVVLAVRDELVEPVVQRWCGDARVAVYSALANPAELAAALHLDAETVSAPSAMLM